MINNSYIKKSIQLIKEYKLKEGKLSRDYESSLSKLQKEYNEKLENEKLLNIADGYDTKSNPKINYVAKLNNKPDVWYTIRIEWSNGVVKRFINDKLIEQ